MFTRRNAGEPAPCVSRVSCARLLGEYSEVAGWLALALEPTALSQGAVKGAQNFVASAKEAEKAEAAPKPAPQPEAAPPPK